MDMVSRLLLPFVFSGCQVVFPLVEESAPLTNCSEMGLLADGFDDALVPPWINERSTRFAVDQGQLSGTVMANVAIARTEPFFDLQNSAFEVRVVRSSLDPQGVAMVSLVLLPTPDRLVDEIAMRVVGENIEIGTITDDGNSGTDDFKSLRTVSYPADKPIWRISYRDGTATFAISDDQGDVVGLDTLEIDLTYVRPRLHAATQNANPLVVRFDDVNRGVSTGRACSARVLADTFDAGPELDLQRWGRTFSSPSCEIRQDNGITFRITNSSWTCQLGGTTVYDLIDHQLDVELVFDPAPNFPLTSGVELNVYNQLTQRAGFQIRGDGSFASFENTTIANSPNGPDPDKDLKTAPYNADLHRFWRLSATRDSLGDKLTFEVSGDGTTFAPFLETSNLSGLDRVGFNIGASGSNPEPQTLKIKRVSVVEKP